MARDNPEPLEEALPQVVNLSDMQVEKINAEMVRIQRGRVGSVSAEEIELNQGSAAQVSGQNVNVHSAWIGAVQAGSVTLNGGGTGIVNSQEVVTSGRAGVIAADGVAMMAGAQAGLLVARQVQAEQVRTIVLLAGQVEGPVETVFDTRRILLASAVTGIAAGVVFLLGQFLFRRKE